ncbi:DUF1638 domain-containing protein [Paracoccus sp. TOH]|uniref:DUF1638 domain-containing protein n=1 Tax=Paracoccus simplex TaxID=2086346 RepID=A0ABV7S5N0_9RHOB|nr:DUF1638 domain-containing protein [Paracoccus sp. TOH]WJS84793.1 DUF1638 domain-containing protein [Paracoccus sp. TOH]
MAAPDQVLVIACGMLAREILAIRDKLGLAHLVLKCLPAELHFHPDRIPAAVEAAILSARDLGFRQIFVGYADCGTGGLLDKVLERQGVARLEGPHCFALYQGAAAVAALEEADVTAFYMTDFLCRQFEAFFVRPLGLDRHPELARDFFGHYAKLVYLAQTEDAALEKVARAAAALLGLSYEKRLTGYGDLAPALRRATGGPGE